METTNTCFKLKRVQEQNFMSIINQILNCDEFKEEEVLTITVMEEPKLFRMVRSIAKRADVGKLGCWLTSLGTIKGICFQKYSEGVEIYNLTEIGSWKFGEILEEGNVLNIYSTGYDHIPSEYDNYTDEQWTEFFSQF